MPFIYTQQDLNSLMPTVKKLLYAAEQGNVAQTKILLESARVFQYNIKIALYRAARYGYVEIMKILLDSGKCSDKGYCTKQARETAAKKCIHLSAIKLNNMRDKNKELDKWRSKLMSPYERVFSQCNKRARYIGIAKNQFAEFMWAMSFNLKILLALDPLQNPTRRSLNLQKLHSFEQI